MENNQLPSLDSFDPTIEKLNALVLESSHLKEIDLENPAQLEQVKRARLNLRSARVSIEKGGKAFRDDAIKFQRAVLEKERSLIAIISPEEDRLAMIEKQAKIAEERKLRLAQVPERRARLESLGLTTKESFITDMDSVAFEQHINALVAEKNEADRLALEKQRKEKEAELDERERALREQEDKADQERREKEAAERAVEEERQHVEREAEAERLRIEEETEERIRQEKEAEKKRQRDVKYQEFLTLNGYNVNTKDQFKIETSEKGVMLWKFVAVFAEK